MSLYIYTNRPEVERPKSDFVLYSIIFNNLSLIVCKDLVKIYNLKLVICFGLNEQNQTALCSPQILYSYFDYIYIYIYIYIYVCISKVSPIL